jgi:hypothetical protein
MCALVIGALSFAPSAGATVNQYFSGSMSSGAHANTSDGYTRRASNSVNRPVGNYFCVRNYYTDFPTAEHCSSLEQPVTLTHDWYYIASCWNYSGSFIINISCWAIQ